MAESNIAVKLVWNGGGVLQHSSAVLPVQLTRLASDAGGKQSVLLEPGKPLELNLAVGAYLLSAELPNGALVTRTIEIGARDAARTIAVDTEDEKRSQPPISDRTAASIPSYSLAEGMPYSESATTHVKLPFYKYLGAVRPAPILSDTSIPWDQLWLRLWDYDPQRSIPWTQQPAADYLATAGFEGSTLALTWAPPSDLHARGKPFFWELGGYGSVSRFTSAPPVRLCDLIIRRSYNPTEVNGGLSLEAVAYESADARIQVFVHYLENRALEAAHSIFEHAVVKALEGKPEPYSALVEAYYLLKFHVSSRRSTDEIESILDTFRQFDASPDAALLCAWLILEASDPVQDPHWLEEAKSNLAESVRRGIPSFVIGLRYLTETVRVMLVSETLSPENRARFEDASRRLGRYLQASDESQLLTTYFARAPWVPDDHDSSQIVRVPDFRIQVANFL